MDDPLEIIPEQLEELDKDQVQRYIHPPQNEIPLTVPESQFYPSYLQFMHENEQSIQDSVQYQQYQYNFRLSYIIYNQQKYEESSITFNMKKQMNPDIIEANVVLGYFKTKLKLLNVNQKCPTHSMKLKGKGIFGQVYLCSLFGCSTVIKALRFPQKQDSIEVIANAVKQYTITRIAHCLGCGPTIRNELGFDLIVYEDAIIFAMSEVTPIYQCKNISEINFRLLKVKLRRLHSFGIIHFDLKPQNIGICCQNQEPTFIDFGISQIIRQKPGQKSFIKFRGNLNFCSKQMQTQYLTKCTQTNFIDVYYSECQSLQKITKEILNGIAPKEMFALESALLLNQNIENIFFVELFKFQILVGHRFSMICKMLTINEQKLNEKYTSQALQFLLNCQLTQKQKKKLLRFESFKKQLHYDRLMNKNIFYSFIEVDQIKHCPYKNHFKRVQTEMKQHNQQDMKQLIMKFKCNYRIELHLNEKINVEQINKNTLMMHFQPIFSQVNNFLLPDGLIQFYFSQYLQRISFTGDEQKLTLKEKFMTASFFNQKVQSQKSIEDGLQNIKQSLKYLLFYCLQQPLNKWKVDHLNHIITQCIILDYLQLPFKAIQNIYQHHATTFTIKMQYLVELNLISDILIHKFRSKTPQRLNDLKSFIINQLNYISELLYRTKEKEDNYKEQYQAVHNCFKFLHFYERDKQLSNKEKLNKLQQFILTLKDELKLIVDRNTRQSFQELIMKQILLRSNSLQNFGLSQRIISSMWGQNLKSAAQQTYTFSQKFIKIFQYMVYLTNHEVTDLLCSSLKKHCTPQIYSQFDFDTESFIIEKYPQPSKPQDLSKLKETIQNFTYQLNQQFFSFNSISNCCIKLSCSPPEFIKQNQDMIIAFMDSYENSKRQHVRSKEQISYELIIVGIFVSVVKDEEKIVNFMEKITDYTQYRLDNQCEQFTKAYVQMYWLPYLIKKRQVQNCFQIVSNFAKLLNNEKHQILKLYIENVKFSFVMLNFQIQDMKLQASIDYIQICIKNNHFFYIFQQEQLDYISIICEYLIEDKKYDLMYQGLLHAAYYINQYPSVKYFDKWIYQVMYLGRKYKTLFQLNIIDEKMEMQRSMEQKEYLLFFPLISLEGSEQEDEKVLKKIAKRSISHLNLTARSVLSFFIFFRIWCNEQLPRKKRKYLVLKKMKPFLTNDQHPISNFAKSIQKRFRLSKRNQNMYFGLLNQKMKKIYVMIYK